MTPDVIDIRELDASMLEVAGGKAAGLGELSRIEAVRVPPGFCITTAAYADTVLRDAAVTAALDELDGTDPADAADAADPAASARAAARVRSAIEALTVPTGLARQVREQVARLGSDRPYAVRSSATAEDLPGASFAGQQESYLDVVGADAVLTHVVRCWASLYTDRAVAYRRRNGIQERDVRLAVVVQAMVPARAAGVMFTADPMTGDRRTVSIDSAPGVGDALVSGRVAPDHHGVRDGRIVARRLADERRDPGTPVLSDSQVLELARLGRVIEAHLGRPQDIEWCLGDGERGAQFWIVQSRPITTLFPIPGVRDGANHVYMSLSHQQMMTDAMRPLGTSFFQTSLGSLGPVCWAGGRMYADLAPDLATPLRRRVTLPALRWIDPLMYDAVATLMKRKAFVAGLSRDGQRLFGLGRGGNYLTWRLPVEAVRAYRRNDRRLIEAIMARDAANLQALRRSLTAVQGEALFDAILRHLGRLREELYDPQSMGALYAGVGAVVWTNSRMKKWLGVASAADVLSRAVDNNVTSQMGLALLDVADVVRRHPAVVEALPRLTDDGFFAGLRGIEGGPEAGRAIASFLATYGARCPGEIDVSAPRWNERPTLLVPTILSNVAAFEPGARESITQRNEHEAELLRRDLISRLERLPRGHRRAARAAAVISRLHTYTGYREYPKFQLVRQMWVIKEALLREARRLADDGVVADPDDVAYLSFDEFREAVRTRHADGALIAARRAEHQAFERLTPPRIITSDGEIVTGRYRRSGVPAGALTGIGVCTGVVEGPARVAVSMADAGLAHGDILVTAFTDPSWTPAFLTAAGLVTEVGGMMTHGAVVAREYGLPAVVGVEGATSRIRDGQRIRVDGSRGYVELL